MTARTVSEEAAAPVETLPLAASDGYAIGARLFGADHAGPVVVINGATAVRQQYYAPFARWLSGLGATVVTYDYRGIGESRPRSFKGFTGRARDWGQLDQDGVLDAVGRRFEHRELVLVGHSIGGQLIGMTRHAARASRVLTVSAQVGSWRRWPAPQKWLFAGVWYALLPALAHTFGYVPGRVGLGEDLPAGVALEWARWCRHDDYFLGHGISRDGFEALTQPWLSYSFADDGYAPKAAVDALHAFYARVQLKRVHLTPQELGVKAVGHFGFFRGQLRELLWERVRPFLLGAVSPPCVVAPGGGFESAGR